MTDAERKALVARLRHTVCHGSLGCERLGVDDQAADQIEADGQRIVELEAALRGILGMWSTRTVDYARAALGETK